jgi:hypothetical protein
MTPDEVTPEEARVIAHGNKFRGRMAGLIESFGLPERQERAAIQTLKSLSYDAEKELRKLVNPDSSVS